MSDKQPEYPCPKEHYETIEIKVPIEFPSARDLTDEITRLKRELKVAIEIAAAVAKPMSPTEFEDLAGWMQEFKHLPTTAQTFWKRRIRRAIKEMTK